MVFHFIDIIVLMDTEVDYSKLKIPTHVGIIVDGNGRWAKERGLSRLKGHDAGFDNLRQLVKYIHSKGVKVLSLYVFSTENFKRAEAEVNHLMDLFVIMYRKYRHEFMENNIKVIFSGRDEPLPAKVISARDELVEMTKDNTGGIVNFCMNYGGHVGLYLGNGQVVHALNPNDGIKITPLSYLKYFHIDCVRRLLY